MGPAPLTPRQFSTIGFVAAFLALAVNPFLDAIGVLVRRPGLVVSVLAPLALGAITVVCGLQVRAISDSKWGTRLVLTGIIAFVLGAIWGATGVI